MSDPGSVFRVGRETITAISIDGRSVTGVVDGFSSEDEHLSLSSESSGVERLATTRLAYVAVHAGGDHARLDLGPGATAFKVHLRNGPTVAVLAPGARLGGRGFRAIPRSDPRYREYFFFRDGVRLRERDEPIGSMLVGSGAVHPEVLEHAIVAQQAHQNTPIGKLLVEALSVSESDLARAVSLQKQKNNRIGDLLIEEGLATAEQIERALAEQRRRKGKRIGEVLLDLDIVSEETLARTLAYKFDLRYVDLDKNPPDPAALGELSRDLIVRHLVLPIQKSDSKLVLAISDPLSLEGLGSLGFSPDRAVEEVVVSKSALKRRIDEFLAEGPKQVEDSEFDFVLEGLGDALPSPEPALRQTPMPRPLSARPEPRRAHASQAAWPVDVGEGDDVLESMLVEAQGRGASDIHVEHRGPELHALVRLRVGRELVDRAALPPGAREAVVARLKELARLDADERRRPQSGKLRLKLGARELQYRVTTLPSGSGLEHVVLCALTSRRFIPLSELDLSRQNCDELERWLAEPRGLVLTVGPADSGKTTTIHALLARLTGPNTVIGSVEGPVEISQAAIRQVEVEPGLTFHDGLQALALADTDVIFVGALCDGRTASATVDHALGRRIFSTVVAGDAGRGVTRLLELGVDAPLLANALVGVVNQRLVKRLCRLCREPVAPTAEQEKAIASVCGADAFARDFDGQKLRAASLARARGCAACADTGYVGSIAVHELLPADDGVRDLIARKAPASEIVRTGRTRRPSLAADGIAKAFAGEAELDEVLRVCR